MLRAEFSNRDSVTDGKQIKHEIQRGRTECRLRPETLTGVHQCMVMYSRPLIIVAKQLGIAGLQAHSSIVILIEIHTHLYAPNQ